MNKFEFEPIGFLRGGGDYPQQAPRQGVYADNRGTIELLPGRNFEAALANLEGFERIWIIFVFDRAGNWRPKVMPPDGSDKKRGVFATRSPHRPNPIGLTAARLLKVSGRTLEIAGFDLLNGTPVLDIKPYIPAADSFALSAAGWRAASPAPHHKVEFSDTAARQIVFLRERGCELGNVILAQLGSRECDPGRQRLARDGDRNILAFRTWRIAFETTFENGRLITGIGSGYTPEELDSPDDRYGDKELHREFAIRFK